jgi:hypothetical protein
MSIDKNYRVMVHLGDILLATYTLHTESQDGEMLDVSSSYTVGEPDQDPVEEEAVETILETEAAHGKKVINGYTVEWFLIN